MTGIPYNYGKYIDDTVKLKDQGFVDAGKQVKSPASAGSRGLNKTTQFTKDKTQMQMGNSPIAESMVEIRNILNRIDGVNVPVQEKRDNSDIDIRKLLVDISSMKDRIAELAIDDDAKTSAFTALAQVEDDIAQEIKGSFPEDVDVDAQFKSDVLQFLNSKVVQIEKQIELAPAKTPEEKENKEFALKLFNFVQAKLEQKDNGDNTITVPKSFKKD